MSRELDYENLSEDDKAWLRARGWGNRIPGEVQINRDEGMILDPIESDEDRLAKVPNYGTATVPTGGHRMPGEDDPDGDDLDESYEDWKVPELEAEIKNRNENREDDDKIVPDGGKKAQLIAALEADDEAHPESDDSE